MSWRPCRSSRWGFSPPDALATLARHLGLDGTVLSDPDRMLYQRLGLHHIPVWHVYSSGTLARYAAAVPAGTRLQRPVEDTRQLGADALVVAGVARRLWRPATPDDRVAPRLVAKAAWARSRSLRRDSASSTVSARSLSVPATIRG